MCQFLPFFNNSWIFVVLFLKGGSTPCYGVEPNASCAALRAVLEVPLSDPVDEIFLLSVAEAFRVAR